MMLNEEKLEHLMGILGNLTDEQKAALTEALEKPISDRELFEKLGGVDEGKFAQYLKAVAAEKEDEVLTQPLSPEELEAVSGGDQDDDLKNFVEFRRNIQRQKDIQDLHMCRRRDRHPFGYTFNDPKQDRFKQIHETS